MDIFEISGFNSGIDKSGVNFLNPADAFETVNNGFIYRQIVYSRKGFSQFANRVPATATPAGAGPTRIMGIFEFFLTNGTKQLIVIDKNYLYKYNDGTNEFDLVPNGSAGVDVYPFNITADDDYVSGTSYPDKDGNSRFVFTGRSMGDVYFYDPSSLTVKRYTNDGAGGGDNPEYVQPTQGVLGRATQVYWFGERLNFIVPFLASKTYNQGVLYSGIRDSSGNGDKYNVPGSGLLQADAYENIKGALILGDFLIINFTRSNWTLEKTRDAFNPYLIRKIPSVLGTDAGFSAVSWAYQVKSIGKTGLITTDGRQTLRFDNKIPNFTNEEIEQINIEQTYGGFDRIEGQFLFSYNNGRSDTQSSVLVFNYEEKTWSIYDWAFSVFGQTDQGQNLTWNQIDENENVSWEKWEDTTEIWNRIGLNEATQKTLAGDDNGFIYQINTDYDDFTASITGISRASSAVITVDANKFSPGDFVAIKNAEGMVEINQENYLASIRVTAVSETTITVNVDSSKYTAYTTGGTVSKVINFNAQTTVFNPYRDKGMKCNVSHIEVLMNTNIGNVYLDIYENSIIPENDNGVSAFKTVQMVPTTSTDNETEWITAIVNDEANFFKFVLRDTTTTNQKIIKALRIHCSPGGLTSG